MLAEPRPFLGLIFGSNNGLVAAVLLPVAGWLDPPLAILFVVATVCLGEDGGREALAMLAGAAGCPCRLDSSGQLPLAGRTVGIGGLLPVTRPAAGRSDSIGPFLWPLCCFAPAAAEVRPLRMVELRDPGSGRPGTRSGRLVSGLLFDFEIIAFVT